MARPKKLHTLQDIADLLSEEAKSFVLLSEKESYKMAVYDVKTVLIFNYLMDAKGKGITGDIPISFKDDAIECYDKAASIVYQGEASEYYKYLNPKLIQNLNTIENSYNGERLATVYFKDIKQDALENVYKNVKIINLFYKWVLIPSTNGKQNFYTVLDVFFNVDGALHEFVEARLKAILFGLVSECVVEDKQQESIFEFIKQALLSDLFIGFLKKSRFKKYIFNTESNLDNIPDDVYQHLLLVTYKDVTYRGAYKPVKKEVIPSLFDVTTVWNTIHSSVIEEMGKLTEKDAVRDLMSGSKRYESDSSDIILDILFRDRPDLPNKSIMTDKIIRTFVKMGISKMNDKTFAQVCKISCSKNELMSMFGFTEEEIEDSKTRYNFTYELTNQLEMLKRATFLSKRAGSGGRAGASIIDFFDTKGDNIYIRAGEEFLQAVLLKNRAFDLSTNQANRIPNKKAIEYYLQIKLENLLANKYNVVKDRDFSKVSSLLEYLSSYKLLDLNNRKYKEKVIDRFIQALDYLQNENQSIEYYFYIDDREKPITEEELEHYKTRADFGNLYLWYTVKGISEYNEEHIGKYVEEFKKNAEKQVKRLERRERAKDKKLGELAAEKELTSKEESLF